MDFTEKECDVCLEPKGVNEFMNYKKSNPKDETTCRSCREQPEDTKYCGACGKTRKLSSFAVHGEYDYILGRYGDPPASCNTCLRRIRRQWSKGRWRLHGFWSRPMKGSHSRVCCKTCLLEMDRRRAATHQCQL